MFSFKMSSPLLNPVKKYGIFYEEILNSSYILLDGASVNLEIDIKRSFYLGNSGVGGKMSNLMMVLLPLPLSPR